VRCKLTIAGVCRVGFAVAQELARRNDADLVLLDAVEGHAEGSAQDLNEAGALLGYEARHVGTRAWEDAAGSQLVVVAGSDLAAMEEVGAHVAERCPDAIVVVTTNPVDAASQLLLKATGFPRARVVGMAGALDSARFRAALAAELGVSVRDVGGLVLGAHGEDMVPLMSSATVHGLPVRLSEERAEAVLARTRGGGDGIVAAAAGVAAIVEAILRDTKRVLACSAFCQGEYGLRDVFVGVPVRLGREGVEEIVELELDGEERAALERSAAGVRAVIDSLG
jgi:malate dehydrogenase